MDEIKAKKKTAEQFGLLVKSWNEYNSAAAILKEIMGGTANMVGEFSEILMAEFYEAQKLTASTISADLQCANGTTIQVKSRMVDPGKTTTQLGIIRHWDFDLLVVVLFYKDGSIFKVLEMKQKDAERYAKWNEYQSGYVITTTKEFLNSSCAKDLTNDVIKMIRLRKKDG